MIKIRIKIKNDKIFLYDSNGHASHFFTSLKSFFFSKTAKYNSICAAVSTLEWTFIYSVENLTSCSIEKKISSGKCQIHLLKEDTKKDFTLLCQSFLIGLKMLHQNYPKIIDLKIENSYLK